MKKKVVWLLVSCLMVAALLLASCAPAVTEEAEEEVGAPEEEEAVVEEEEETEPPAGKEVDIPVILQEGNSLPKIQFESNKSNDLLDNRIGNMFGLRWDIHTQQDADGLINHINNVGYKWVRLSLDHFDWSEIEETGDFSRFYIDPIHDSAITGLTNNGVKIMYCLVFWDENIQTVRDYARFKTEEEVEHYLEYVRFIVQNLKDRIEYYEILNETFFSEYTHFTQQNIEITDYVNLVKRTIPVIREEHPEAKIVAGPAPGIHDPDCRNYFFSILESEIMPLVDAVSWHPGPYCLEYDDLREYFNEYPSIVQRIMNVASSHGFGGEYIAEEIQWRTQGARYEPWTFSATVAAKYYARGIVMHLGMNIISGIAGGSHELDIPKMRVIRNLCTVMAGADSITIPAEIECEITNIRSYGFSLPNGDRLLALWTDGVAIDDDPGIETTLTFRNISAQKVVAIDVLNSFQQELITSVEEGNLVIYNLLVKDYPIILRLIP